MTSTKPIPPFAPLWDGLGLFSTALLLWIFITPCDLSSPSLYFPPFIVGLMLGLGASHRSWSLRAGGAVVYAIALLILTAAIIYFTDGPWSALAFPLLVIALLIAPSTVLGLAIGEALVSWLRARGKAKERNYE